MQIYTVSQAISIKIESSSRAITALLLYDYILAAKNYDAFFPSKSIDVFHHQNDSLFA